MAPPLSLRYHAAVKILLSVILLIMLWLALPEERSYAQGQEESATDQQYDEGETAQQQQADLNCEDFDFQEEAQAELERPERPTQPRW
jgi:hypothetical protein